METQIKLIPDPDPEEEIYEDDDVGLNHDEADDLSLNIDDGDEVEEWHEEICPGSVIVVQNRTADDSEKRSDYVKTNIPAWHAACIALTSLVLV